MEFYINETNKKSIPVLILISGKARSGKDTFAQYLKQIYESADVEHRVLIVHYADYLKYLCTKYYNWDGKKDVEGRTLLQLVGNSYRLKDPNFWVNNVLDFIHMEESKYDLIIIPDARYQNEIAIPTSKYNTCTIRIHRDDFENGLTTQQQEHPSENDLDEFSFDLDIDNAGTAEDLYQEAKKFLESKFMLK